MIAIHVITMHELKSMQDLGVVFRPGIKLHPSHRIDGNRETTDYYVFFSK